MNGKAGKRHVIRLRGPWEIEPLVRFEHSAAGEHREETADLPAGGKTLVPGDWGHLLGANFLGRARYTRRFNCPTNLDPHERVWLVFDGVSDEAQVSLNGQPLGGFAAHDCPHEYEITPLLVAHNMLSVEVCLRTASDHRGGLVGEVRLEIGRDAAK